jgi:class 3 adenylate cyclase
MSNAVKTRRVQRRLAAILAADVAGYSRLTGADEEVTIARLKALQRDLIDPLITSHGGRIEFAVQDEIAEAVATATREHGRMGSLSAWSLAKGQRGAGAVKRRQWPEFT